MKRELNKLYKNGNLTECSTLLQRYYQILNDKGFTIDSGHYEGHNRTTTFSVNREIWTRQMLNGKVYSIGKEY